VRMASDAEITADVTAEETASSGEATTEIPPREEAPEEAGKETAAGEATEEAREAPVVPTQDEDRKRLEEFNAEMSMDGAADDDAEQGWQGSPEDGKRPAAGGKAAQASALSNVAAVTSMAAKLDNTSYGVLSNSPTPVLPPLPPVKSTSIYASLDITPRNGAFAAASTSPRSISESHSILEPLAYSPQPAPAQLQVNAKSISPSGPNKVVLKSLSVDSNSSLSRSPNRPGKGAKLQSRSLSPQVPMIPGQLQSQSLSPQALTISGQKQTHSRSPNQPTKPQRSTLSRSFSPDNRRPKPAAFLGTFSGVPPVGGLLSNGASPISSHALSSSVSSPPPGPLFARSAGGGQGPFAPIAPTSPLSRHISQIANPRAKRVSPVKGISPPAIRKGRVRPSNPRHNADPHYIPQHIPSDRQYVNPPTQLRRRDDTIQNEV
jgi:hypothetical protein